MVPTPARRRARRLPTLAGAIAATALAIAGCGGGSDGEPDAVAAGSGSGATKTADDGVTAAQQRLDALFEGKTFKSPPTSGPAPEAGKNVWVISVGLAAPDVAEVAAGAQEAGKLLGWKVTSYDGKFEPARFLDGVREAIAAKADGIFLYVIDCSTVKAGLEAARKAGIEVAAAESEDCAPAGESGALFDGNVAYTQGTFNRWAASAGAAQADWLIARTAGKANVVNLFQSDATSARAIQRGFVDTMKTCKGCEVVTVEFTGTDLGVKLQEKVQQALVSNPDATALQTPYDGAHTAGVSAAVMASGRNDDLLVVAGGGVAANADLVRSNKGQDAGYGTSLAWEGWAGVDVLNRLFNGEEPAPSGIGMEVFDAEHNLPASGPWAPKVDFKSAYKKAWRVE